VLELIYMGFTPYLIGPSGSGKTHFARLAMATYCSYIGKPLFFFQNSPEATKTKAIAGQRLVAGSTEEVRGIVAHAMALGAGVIIDELTHAKDASGITMYNTVLDEDHVTATGDMTLFAEPTFRVMFASNDDKHVGNIRIPQSTAQRFYTYKFDYPSYVTEMEVALQMAREKYEPGQLFKHEIWKGQGKNWTPKPFAVPEAVARFLTGYVRSVRTPSYPLSIRNISQALVRAQMAFVFENKRKPYNPSSVKMDDVFVGSGVATTPLNQRFYEYIYGDGSGAKSRNQLADPLINEFKQFVSFLGGEKMREEFLASVGYDLPIDGQGVGREHVKQDLLGKLF